MKGIDQDNLVNYRFSRRLGEQVPDACYACAIEGPRPSRLRKVVLAFLLVVAIIATLGALS